ncbi:MAG: hypothetical protein RR405_05285, partial [Clostridia bacterium]
TELRDAHLVRYYARFACYEPCRVLPARHAINLRVFSFACRQGRPNCVTLTWFAITHALRVFYDHLSSK